MKAKSDTGVRPECSMGRPRLSRRRLPARNRRRTPLRRTVFKGKARAVIVTTPQQMATIDVDKCITFCSQLDLPITGVIENMSGFVCPDCGKRSISSLAAGVKTGKSLYNIPFPRQNTP